MELLDYGIRYWSCYSVLATVHGIRINRRFDGLIYFRKMSLAHNLHPYLINAEVSVLKASNIRWDQIFFCMQYAPLRDQIGFRASKNAGTRSAVMKAL